jgi:23S rRNA (cytosine1962-C5)-methyltransferase
MKVVRLKPQRACRAAAGHPWAFAGDVALANAQRVADGESVELRDAGGRSLGAGVWSNRSQIVWRRHSRAPRPFDAAFVAEALAAAVARRGFAATGGHATGGAGDATAATAATGASAGGDFQRLVWSEADNLSGLVVDKFGDVLVMQALTVGADNALPVAAEWLRERFAPREIIFRNDAPVRARDGLPLETRTLTGGAFAPAWFRIEGVEYLLDLQGGQKTGFYLDQRPQHPHVARFAKGRRVLDAFCNQGGFALHAAKAGAADVLGLDISAACVAAAAGNAVRNALPARFEQANVFDWFTRARAERGSTAGAQFDLIILDPPPFARSREAFDGALRGYKEINLRAMQMLAPGGILATYSCSQRVEPPVFAEVLAEAAADARREVRLIEETGQPPDHPVLLGFPESRYLKGAILRVE